MVARQFGPGYPIDPPSYQPPLHGLLSSSVYPPEAPSDRWELGFEFEPEGRVGAVTYAGPVCDPDTKATKPVLAPPPLVDYAPFQVVTTYVCPWGRTEAERQAKVRAQLAAAEQKYIERELWAGTQTDLGNSMVLSHADADVLNPGFTDGVDAPADATPVDLITGLALLGNYLAEQPSGSRGMLHVTSFVGEVAAAGGLWEEDGRAGASILRTKGRGDVVVVGSGYLGTGPGGIVPAAGTVWLYATPMVHVRLGDVTILGVGSEGMRRTSNFTITHIAERTAAAYWDGTPAGAVLVDVNAAWIVGGGGSDPGSLTSGVTVSDTAPAGPTEGMLWYESDTGVLFLYVDGAWVQVGGA